MAENKRRSLISSSPVFYSSLLVFLFIASFGIRLYHIDRPPLDFAEVRQYQVAHIARGLYIEGVDSIPEWEKRIARLNMERMGFLLEPRIMERAAVLGYKITGGEHLWFPRLLSSIFWLVGGFFLYLTAKRISSPGAALVSAAFYLFLPYSILASRSFQPDPLMTMMMLGGIFFIVMYYEEQSFPKLFAAAFFSSFAILVKPYSLFMIFGAFVSLSIYKQGIRKSLTNRNSALFLFLSLVPAGAYYISLFLNSAGFLKEHTEGSFLPHLFLHLYFWTDWLNMIALVVGYIALACALLGLLFIRDKLSRSLLAGLWIGYFMYGLSAPYQIHTHNYYHIPIIPIVALSMGPLICSLINRLYDMLPSWKMLGVLGILFLSAAVGLWFCAGKINLREHKEDAKTIGAIIGVYPQFLKFISDDFEKEMRIAKEIGNITGHSANALLLTSDFGRSIAYNGELSGLPWPNSVSLQERSERGLNIPDKKELFNARYLTVRSHGKYIRYTPDFFIITAFDELEKQKDLKDFLTLNFPVLARSDDYLIFDLRKMSQHES